MVQTLTKESPVDVEMNLLDWGKGKASNVIHTGLRSDEAAKGWGGSDWWRELGFAWVTEHRTTRACYLCRTPAPLRSREDNS